MQKLANGVYAVDLCLYLPDRKALIIADIHLGYEEHLQKKGVLVPRVQYDQVIKRLDWILNEVEVKEAILNGDVKHEFGTISKQEWREVLRLLDYFKSKNIKVTAVKGNHDTILGPIARMRQLKEVRELRHGDILITHGDYIPKKLAKIILMGHEHPAITLREESKAEKYKCFIKGTFKGKTLIVQPALNPLTQGTDVLKEQVLSPLLSNLSNFDVFVVNDKTHEVLKFGKVKEFR